MTSISPTYRYLFAAAFVISCFFISACENSQKDIDAWTKNKDLKEEAIQVEALMSQGGNMKAKLKAPLMYRVTATRSIDTSYLEFPKALHVDFYDDSARIETRLDCLYGKYFESLDKVYLRDSVVVITVKGDTLRSPDLWWDQNKGIFYTDKFAQYHAKDQQLVGNKGLIATQDLKTVTFQSPEGVMNLSSTGFSK
jgi:LPS export ABC transporter protein LptC